MNVMKNRILAVFIFFLFSVGLCGCSPTEINNNLDNEKNNGNINQAVEPTLEEITGLETDDMFTDKDLENEYDESEYESIVGSVGGVEVEDSSVDITNDDIIISEGGNYLFTGEMVNKSIIVNTSDTEKVYIVLNNITMTNDNYACIYVIGADKVFINIDGINSLKSTGFVQRDDNNVDGVIFSKSDITIQGAGKLNIESSIHGLVGKDDLKITSGIISIKASSHGISANDSIRITTAQLEIESAKDGIKSDNDEDASKGYIYIESGNININSGYDGMSSSNIIQIEDVNLNVITNTAPSTEISSKGIKASSNVIINNGTITINSKDDGIHSNGSISISNPTIQIASEDDGIHADTSLVISGGSLNVTKSYEGLEAQNVEIAGGDIKVVASDDGINAAGGNDSSSTARPGYGGNSFNSSANAYIKITGGNLYIDASGDGVDANGALYVSGGYTLVEGPTNQGNGALDYDGSAEITGGVFIATGAQGMAMNFSTATQGSILYSMSVAKGEEVKVADSSGNEIIKFTATKAAQSLLISSPKMTLGNSYVIAVGATSATIELSQYLYSSGGSSIGGMMPSRPGR